VTILGSGESAAFGLPTMQKLVASFEESLKTALSNTPSQEIEDMLNKYESIKQTLKDAYCYADLESVFSLANNIKYTDLGFTSTYRVHGP